MSVQVILVLKHSSNFLPFYPSEAKIAGLRKNIYFCWVDLLFRVSCVCFGENAQIGNFHYHSEFSGMGIQPDNEKNITGF